ncbi:MAG: HEPN domain-containing protein [SAR202 cluster bacterium]|nr:HEPN domain-containing protein [SAR202 cluster bacterium]
MKNSPGEARRWFLQAEHELAIAKHSLSGGFHSHVLFVSHQTAEKCLKALAYHRGDRTARGHSLVELVADLKSSFPPLEAFVNLANRLDKYYSPTRYPDALPGGSALSSL